MNNLIEQFIFFPLKPVTSVSMIFRSRTRKHTNTFRIVHDGKLKVLKVGPLLAKQLSRLKKNEKFTLIKTIKGSEIPYYELKLG